MHEVICNTSPIQYLYQSGHLSLLKDIYQKIVIPEAVLKEIEDGRRLNFSLPDLQTISWIEIRAIKAHRMLSLITSLGQGEREVLSLGVESPDSVLILDDLLARRYANYLKLRFTGTLGILLKAKQLGLIPAIKPKLKRFEELKFRIDKKTYWRVLDIAGEST